MLPSTRSTSAPVWTGIFRRLGPNQDVVNGVGANDQSFANY